jgi:hypothetical protein
MNKKWLSTLLAHIFNTDIRLTVLVDNHIHERVRKKNKAQSHPSQNSDLIVSSLLKEFKKHISV